MKTIIVVALLPVALIAAFAAGDLFQLNAMSARADLPARTDQPFTVGTSGDTRRRVPDTMQVKEGSSEVKLPAGLPGPTKNVVITNPGVLVAVSRFYRLLQSSELQASDVISPPFNLDGRKVLSDEKEIQAFIDKARDGSLKEGRTNTLLQATLLPQGNTWEEAQRWLAPATTGERAKALFDHAAKHNGWLVLVLVARSKGDKHVSEYTLIAVADGDSEEKARVIGFMD